MSNHYYYDKYMTKPYRGTLDPSGRVGFDSYPTISWVNDVSSGAYTGTSTVSTSNGTKRMSFADICKILSEIDGQRDNILGTNSLIPPLRPGIDGGGDTGAALAQSLNARQQNVEKYMIGKTTQPVKNRWENIAIDESFETKKQYYQDIFTIKPWGSTKTVEIKTAKYDLAAMDDLLHDEMGYRKGWIREEVAKHSAPTPPLTPVPKIPQQLELF